MLIVFDHYDVIGVVLICMFQVAVEGDYIVIDEFRSWRGEA
jgi:hypothetical protein